jgi:hypothetical protein
MSFVAINRRRSYLLLLTLAAVLSVSLSTARGQGRHGEVMVTVANDKVIALPPAGSSIEEGLGLNETVESTAARGQSSFAQTSIRLLGFSSELRRWADVQLAAEERVERHHVLPRLIVAQTNRQVYGFQEGRAHWTNEPLGANERVKQLHGRGHVAIAITSDRALAFSSYTGGFFSIPWSNDERVVSIDEANDAVMVRTSSRQLVFRSQTTEWTEVK